MSRMVEVRHGDSREVLKTLKSASIDAVVTDPPYALVSIGKRFGKSGAKPARSNGASGVYRRASAGFMGQTWDTGETAFDPAFWAEVLRVLKPGGHLVAFSGTRTYHRLACAIEDAGFEIRDMIAWLYGSGFPKSHDISKAVDKHLKVSGRVEAKGAPVRRIRPGADQHKVGWEKLDDRTYQPGHYVPGSAEAEAWRGFGSALKPALEPVVFARKALDGALAANVLRHGCGGLNVDGCRIGGAGGTRKTPSDDKCCTDSVGGFLNADADAGVAVPGLGRWPANVVHDGSAEVVDVFPSEAGAFAPVRGTEPSAAVTHVYGERARVSARHHGDAGSAARFFYSAKAGELDRLGSAHPTVKPVDLMAWLCRLITPPGGVVLDPFAGSGTTGLAALREGFGAVLIEREAKFVADIERKIAWAQGEGRLTVLESARALKPDEAAGADLPLFAEANSQQPAASSQQHRGHDPAVSSTASSRGTSDRADGIEAVNR